MNNEKRRRMFLDAGDRCCDVASVMHDRMHGEGFPAHYIYRQTDVFDFQSDQWYAAASKLARGRD